MIRASFVIVLALLSAGCGELKPVPKDTFYRLLVKPTPPSDHLNLGSRVIEVAPFRAVGVYRERAIVFSDAAGLKLQQHHYHFWNEAPAALLRAHLIDYLRDADPEAVVLEASSAPVDIVIHGVVKRFERAVFDKVAEARVSIEFTIRDKKQSLPVMTKQYSVEISAASSEVEASVTALAEALTQLYARFVHDAVIVLNPAS